MDECSEKPVALDVACQGSPGSWDDPSQQNEVTCEWAASAVLHIPFELQDGLPLVIVRMVRRQESGSVVAEDSKVEDCQIWVLCAAYP